MISSFFSKSKPIHSIIILALISLIFLHVRFQSIIEHLVSLETLKQIAILVLAVFSIFVLDFIIGKNNLTQKNSFSILIFGLLIALIPQSLSNTTIILANVFILFALRRLVSLHSKIDIKKKLFDATFWIALASLFYFWALLFFVLVLVALLYYAQNDLKNWIVPVATLVMITILVMAFNIITEDNFISPDFSLPSLSFDFSSYNSLGFIIALTLIFTIVIWTSIFYIKLIREVTGKLKPAFILIGISVLVAIVILVIAPIKTGSEFLFLFAPLSIIMAKYLERVKDLRFKEVLILLLVIAPIINLVL